MGFGAATPADPVPRQVVGAQDAVGRDSALVRPHRVATALALRETDLQKKGSQLTRNAAVSPHSATEDGCCSNEQRLHSGKKILWETSNHEQDIDNICSLLCDDWYFEGHHASLGDKLAAVLYCRPRYGQAAGVRLLAAPLAIRGWIHKSHQKSETSAVCGGCVDAVERGSSNGCHRESLHVLAGTVTASLSGLGHQYGVPFWSCTVWSDVRSRWGELQNTRVRSTSRRTLYLPEDKWLGPTVIHNDKLTSR